MISALTRRHGILFLIKLFDSLQKKYRFQRTFLVRAMHAVGFETGLIITLIPVAMVMLDLPLTEAFFVEIGLVLFSCHTQCCLTGYTITCVGCSLDGGVRLRCNSPSA